MDDSCKSQIVHGMKSCSKREKNMGRSNLASQRPMWEALKKSINRLVDKLTVSNIRNVAEELSSENLIWGRGLFCSKILKSSISSSNYAPVFASLIAAINSKFPDVGYLLLKRIVSQFRIALKQKDKSQLLPLVKLLAHVLNQEVVQELIAIQLLFLLLQDPTEDIIQVAVVFVRHCGSALYEFVPGGLDSVFDRFCEILSEEDLDAGTVSLIEGLLAIRKSGFSGYVAVPPELDIVEPDDQVTHEISLSNLMDPEMFLDVFRPYPPVLTSNDEQSKTMIEEDAEVEQETIIEDEIATEIVNLRKTIYLTLMSGFNFEDAGHKLLGIPLRPSQEMELWSMLIECCSHQKTYSRYFAMVAQRLCLLNNVHRENLETCFALHYSRVHHLETQSLRNVAKFFAHLLSSDSLPWHVFAYIRLTEEDTTSSSQIFIKILFQELADELGIPLLKQRLNDPTNIPTIQESIFPKDSSRNMRFSINFFTSIGLGCLTDNLRECLKYSSSNAVQVQNQASHSFSIKGQDAASSSSKSNLLKSKRQDPFERHGKRSRIN